jgi:hypothetical protein
VQVPDVVASPLYPPSLQHPVHHQQHPGAVGAGIGPSPNCGLRLVMRWGRLALAPQFFDASADRYKIISGVWLAHVISFVRFLRFTCE